MRDLQLREGEEAGLTPCSEEGAGGEEGEATGEEGEGEGMGVEEVTVVEEEVTVVAEAGTGDEVVLEEVEEVMVEEVGVLEE